MRGAGHEDAVNLEWLFPTLPTQWVKALQAKPDFQPDVEFNQIPPSKPMIKRRQHPHLCPQSLSELISVTLLYMEATPVILRLQTVFTTEIMSQKT